LRKNSGFTLVELIIVLACLSMVTLFFWSILSSSSEDSYTLTDKVAVQSSVTSLMNIIEKDVQEARIITSVDTGDKWIVLIDGNKYVFNTASLAGYNDRTIEYVFDEANGIVTRSLGKEDTTDKSVYRDIKEFSMSSSVGEKYRVDVKIVGGKELDPSKHDKSRFELNSTFYSRNTI